MSYHLTPDPARPGSYRLAASTAKPGWAHVVVFHLPALVIAHVAAFLAFENGLAHPVLILMGAAGALGAHWIGVARMPRLLRTGLYMALYGGASIYLLRVAGADLLWTAAVVVPLLWIVWRLGTTYNAEWVLPPRLRRVPTGTQILFVTVVVGVGAPAIWRAGFLDPYYVHVACFGRGGAEAAAYLRDYVDERPRTVVDHTIHGDSIIRIYMGPYARSRAHALAAAISLRTYEHAGERPEYDRPCEVETPSGRPPRVATR